MGHSIFRFHPQVYDFPPNLPIIRLLASSSGEGNGDPLQCSCLENPRDKEPGGLPSTPKPQRCCHGAGNDAGPGPTCGDSDLLAGVPAPFFF